MLLATETTVPEIDITVDHWIVPGIERPAIGRVRFFAFETPVRIGYGSNATLADTVKGATDAVSSKFPNDAAFGVVVVLIWSVKSGRRACPSGPVTLKLPQFLPMYPRIVAPGQRAFPLSG